VPRAIGANPQAFLPACFDGGRPLAQGPQPARPGGQQAARAAIGPGGVVERGRLQLQPDRSHGHRIIAVEANPAGLDFIPQPPGSDLEIVRTAADDRRRTTGLNFDHLQTAVRRVGRCIRLAENDRQHVAGELIAPLLKLSPLDFNRILKRDNVG
jgi:hypothetical protein